MVKTVRTEFRRGAKAFGNHKERGKAVRIEEVYGEVEKSGQQ